MLYHMVIRDENGLNNPALYLSAGHLASRLKTHFSWLCAKGQKCFSIDLVYFKLNDPTHRVSCHPW